MTEVFRYDIECNEKPKQTDEYRIEKHLGKYYHLYKWIIIVIANILPILLIVYNYKDIFFWIISFPLIGFIAWIDIKATIITAQWIWYWLRLKYFYLTIDISNYFTVRCGCPGSGKTSSSIQEAYVIAQIMWEELKWAFIVTCQKWKKIKASGNKNEIAKAQFIMKSYRFWNSNKNLIPCLCSNIDITDEYGRKSYHIDRKNLLQERPIPYMSVIFWDEIGLDFPCSNNSKNREKWKPLASLGRLTRHFGEFHFIITEQDKQNVFKDLRRVVAENRIMQKQEWVCKASLLDKLYNLLRTWIINKIFGKYDEYPIDVVKKHILSIRRQSQVKLLIRLNVLIRSCGYRKYKYVAEGNTEFNNDNVLSEKLKTFILPSTLYVQYDDKYYAKDYTVREKEIINDYNTFKQIVA